MTSKGSNCFKEYAEVAEKLIEEGYYDGLFATVAMFAKRVWSGGFIVLDLPSGEGKTLFGVALFLLDKDHNPRRTLPPVLAEVSINWKVVHCIWKSAVSGQAIYDNILQIQRKAGVYANKVFDCAKFLDPLEMAKLDEEQTEKYLWFTVLQHIFHTPGSGSIDDFDLKAFRSNFKMENCRLILFLDEIPMEAEDVLVITKLRDACKVLDYVIIILSGTNSKAANMLGIGEASQKVESSKPWAVLATRTPAFQIKLSNLSRSWEDIKHKIVRNFQETDLKFAVNAIESSIKTHGNSRLIVMAIKTLNDLIEYPTDPSFQKFRINFSAALQASKFSSQRCSTVHHGLLGQLNMLCEASTVAEYSDYVISSHFARRAVPDMGLAAGTTKHCAVEDCAGHLYISAASERCLGFVMYYAKGDVASVVDASRMVRSWQTAVFSSFEQDMLLYLGACGEQGFFHVNGPCFHRFNASEVCLSAWKWHAAGLINFQNLRANINPGSLLEVITTASICNAAALNAGDGITEFMVRFAVELGICFAANTKKLFLKQMSQDNAFEIPSCVFPGTALPSDMGETIGIVKRVENQDQFDLELILPCNKKVRFEVKDRKQLSSRHIWTVASKLFATNEQFGALVVQDCCNYWGSDTARDRPSMNRDRIKSFFRNKKTKFVSRIYFVRSDGELCTIDLPEPRGQQPPTKQFLFVFQVKNLEQR